MFNLAEWRRNKAQAGLCSTCYARPRERLSRCLKCVKSSRLYNQSERGKQVGRRSYYKHRDKKNIRRKISGKAFRDMSKKQVFAAYGGKCVCCSESIIGFLTIDHINRKTFPSVAPRGGYHLYRWLILNGFPPGVRIMCFNCNSGRALNNGICPHELERQIAIKLSEVS